MRRPTVHLIGMPEKGKKKSGEMAIFKSFGLEFSRTDERHKPSIPEAEGSQTRK